MNARSIPKVYARGDRGEGVEMEPNRGERRPNQTLDQTKERERSNLAAVTTECGKEKGVVLRVVLLGHCTVGTNVGRYLQAADNA